jgi:hypothetical protein
VSPSCPEITPAQIARANRPASASPDAAQYIASGKTYNPRSNHGLEQDLALMEAALVVPELSAATEWRALAATRTTAYVRDNFSPEGVHKEQSPFYHRYVLNDLRMLLEFLDAYGEAAPPEVATSARRAAAVWPYFVQPNGQVPLVGDTPRTPARRDLGPWRSLWDQNTPVPAASTLPNPRSDGGEFLLSFDAGYAVFTAYPAAARRPDPDTYALFKCNAFEYTHYHADALSFTLFGLGHEWIVDSGFYSYDEETPQRQYVRSARAHNVVLIDNRDFSLRTVRLLDRGRDERGDYVTVRHELVPAQHTRTFAFVPPRTVEITDTLTSADGRPHTYTQLFHAASELTVRLVNDRFAELLAADGTCCRIEQTGAAGAWSTIRGQKEPVWRGWFSPADRELVANTVLLYTTQAPANSVTFTTRLRLVPSDAAGPPGR